ncbi:hypothetical protein PVAND_014129 [Polypedilum vanderplanki]|uniref:Reverse transcriptase domain-containing protein n=1 Tax=Polypedilum vanderplanki TaxID=319348 RepID=A0A9J6CRT6_POLVA|nr:hypothetical protein PVAND_014129 [Polypedilum vanderplanki]
MGGVLLLIRNSIPHKFYSNISYDYAEGVSIKIANSFIVSSIYCSPSVSRNKSKIFFKKLSEIPGPHLIGGDFNAKNISWNNSSSDLKGSDIFNIFSNKNYKFHSPDSVTHIPYIGNPSCIDFAISRNVSGITNLKVINDLSSDHLPIIFKINSHISKNESFAFNFKKANWKKINEFVHINCLAINNNIISNRNIDECILQIEKLLKNSLIKFVPKKNNNHSVRYKYSSEIDLLIKERNHLRNQYKKTAINHFRSLFYQINRLIRSRIAQHKLELFKDKLASLSTRDNSIFSLTKALKKKKCSIPPLIGSSNLVYSDEDKANSLANTFKNNHLIVNSIDPVVRRSINKITNNFDLSVPFDEESIVDTLCSLNVKKAVGFDKIPNILLKNLANNKRFTQLLYILFNECLQNAYFPDRWKVAIIIPIPKTKIPSDDPTQYRPISLISCLGKCLEKLILDRLNKFESENNVFIKEQFGFRKRHSTTHQLVRLVESACVGFNLKKSTAMAFLDIHKAFDTVWHDGILHKLLQNKYPIYLIKLLKSYLSNRYAFVRINNSSSCQYEIAAGVPQGSLLAPHLFNVFLNDIPLPKNAKLSIFADDTAIAIEIGWKKLELAKKKTYGSS